MIKGIMETNINIIPQEQQLIPAIHGQTAAGEVNDAAEGKHHPGESSGFRTIRSITNDLPEDATPRAKAARPKKQKQSQAKKSPDELLSDGLNEEQKVVLARLLKEIPEVCEDYSRRRSEFGKLLYELQQVFSTAGKNGRFQKCLNHLHIPKSTAYDLIGRYQRIKDLPDVIVQAADQVNIDLGAPKVYSRFEELRFSRKDLDLAEAKRIIEPLTKKAKREVTSKFGPGITDEEKKVFPIYDALQRSMGDLTNKEKKELLTEALNLFAHYDLQCQEPFSISVVPTKAEDDWVLLPSKGKTMKEVTCP